MAEFCYDQQLHRRRGRFESFAAGISFVSILTTIFQLAAPPTPRIAVPSELPELDADWEAAFDSLLVRVASGQIRVCR